MITLREELITALSNFIKENNFLAKGSYFSDKCINNLHNKYAYSMVDVFSYIRCSNVRFLSPEYNAKTFIVSQEWFFIYNKICTKHLIRWFKNKQLSSYRFIRDKINSENRPCNFYTFAPYLQIEGQRYFINETLITDKDLVNIQNNLKEKIYAESNKSTIISK